VALDIAMLNKKRKIYFLIYPTIYCDFDVIAVGDEKALRKFRKKQRGSHFIKKSTLGLPMVLLETFDTANKAAKCIEALNKEA